MKIFIIFFSSVIMFYCNGCDWPFNTETTDDDLLVLSLNHAIVRVMPSALVNLDWNEITVDNFKEYIIERKTVTDTVWTEVVKLPDAFLTNYVDTIVDDDDVIYRVGIADLDNNILWSSATISIPKTTSVLVPDEYNLIQDAFDSELMDDGDTVIVKPGYYTERLLVFSGKDVLIQSTNGYKTTIIDGNSSTIHTISISSGTVDGFTITGGFAFNKAGGGVFLKGNGIVRNCLINNNIASDDHYGGGLYILDNGSVYNSIISNNICAIGSGMYIKDAHGEIINNTIFNDDIIIGGDCNGLILRNNIIYNSQPDITYADQASKTGVTIDYSRFDLDIGFGSNNIIDDPQFIDNVDFLLRPTSLCIDAGHPGDEYLDVDGTRNDIGAYGGPGAR